MPKGEKLTAKQMRFVVEYLVDLNGTQAAIRAGYSEKSAARIAYKLMLNPRIKAAIQQEAKKLIERAEIRSWSVLREAGRLAFANISDFVQWTGTSFRLKPDAMIPKEARAAIAEISDTRYGIKLKMHSKPEALRLLFDYLALSQSGAQDDGGSSTVFVAPEMCTEESWRKISKS